jgi:hypothetical protein
MAFGMVAPRVSVNARTLVALGSVVSLRNCWVTSEVVLPVVLPVAEAPVVVTPVVPEPGALGTAPAVWVI